MAKMLRIMGKVLAGIILLWFVLGIGAWIYFETHKARLTEQADAFLNSRFQGSIHIRSIAVNLWNNFPYPALQMNDVTIDDSVYSPRSGQHSLYMEKIRIIPGFSGLLRGHPVIRKVVLERGGLNLYRDSTGYYNGYVWSGKKISDVTEKDEISERQRQDRLTGKGNDTTTVSLPLRVQINDVTVSIADSIKHKSYAFDVHHLSLEQQNGHWQTGLDVTVQSLAFNTQKGSFLKDQPVRGRGKLDYSITKKVLSFQGLALQIGEQELIADGAFHFDETHLFDIHLVLPSIAFSAARSWLSNNIGRKLDSVSFEHPFAVDASIGGKLSGGGDPKIMVRWTVRNNTLSGYIGTLYDCSFTGYFSNTVNDTLPSSDPNSVIRVDSMVAKYENTIAFLTRHLEIRRLDTAVMVFDLAVHDDIGPWDKLLQSEDLSFDKGQVDMDLIVNFPFSGKNSLPASMSGTVGIKDAEITYLPRDIKISDGQADFVFDHQDLVIRTISGKLGKSPVKLTGVARNLLSFANAVAANPGRDVKGDAAPDTSKMQLDWKLSSPSLDLGNLMPFLGKGSARRPSGKREDAAAGGKGSARPLAGTLLDRYIRRCTVSTQLKIDQLNYNHFSAANVNAGLYLNNGLLSLSEASLQTAKGSITLSGTLNGSGEGTNRAKLKAVLTHLDLSNLFYGFDNFGQESLKSHNLSGILNARADLSMLLTDKGRKVPGSLEGSLDFTIDQGALLNFSPLTKLSNFALKNRDLSHVYFAQLHDQFGFAKDTVAIHKMEIQSSVLEMFVEGVYKLDGTFTDADIQVPFRNLKKRKTVHENVGADAAHGLSIYVHAFNTGQEPLHYKFGLFKKKIRAPEKTTLAPVGKSGKVKAEKS